MLHVHNLDISYGAVQTVRGVNLEVAEKEVVSIVGSNGAGKTTIINALSGLLPIGSGEVEFRGVRINGLSPDKIVELGLVQVPEGRLVFPEMTVHENLLIGGYSKTSRNHIEKNLEEMHRIFPVLDARKHQQAGSLSGGEQQMLAIARSLMSMPKLLMLDEPSLGLAPLIVREVFSIIDRIHDQGMSILLVEQNVYHALSISDRAYVIENGRVTMEGTGEELINNKEIEKAYLGI